MWYVHVRSTPYLDSHSSFPPLARHAPRPRRERVPRGPRLAWAHAPTSASPAAQSFHLVQRIRRQRHRRFDFLRCRQSSAGVRSLRSVVSLKPPTPAGGSRVVAHLFRLKISRGKIWATAVEESGAHRVSVAALVCLQRGSIAAPSEEARCGPGLKGAALAPWNVPGRGGSAPSPRSSSLWRRLGGSDLR